MQRFGATSSILPDQDGSLSLTVPSSRIEAVKLYFCQARPLLTEKTLNIIDDEDGKTSEKDKGKGSMRGEYEKFSADEKARVGKRAAEHSVLATICHFSKVYQDHPLKESTVRGWKKQYNREVLKLRKAGKEVVVRELIYQKRGRPLLLGDQ